MTKATIVAPRAPREKLVTLLFGAKPRWPYYFIKLLPWFEPRPEFGLSAVRACAAVGQDSQDHDVPQGGIVVADTGSPTRFRDPTERVSEEVGAELVAEQRHQAAGASADALAPGNPAELLVAEGDGMRARLREDGAVCIDYEHTKNRLSECAAVIHPPGASPPSSSIAPAPTPAGPQRWPAPGLPLQEVQRN
jgi:hypothetical protein